jgi:hypothetical protein
MGPPRLAALGLLLFTTTADAHGAAAWIMQNSRTAPCCGERDCEILPDDAVREVRGGFLIKDTGEVIPYNDAGRLFTSIDEHFWWCHYKILVRQQTVLRVRCLFVPGSG